MNTTTNQNHTHRFDDEGICTRCGRTYADVVAEREAAATEADADTRSKARREMDAAAAQNDRKDRAAVRRSYYERTGR